MRFSRQIMTVEEALRRLLDRLAAKDAEEVELGESYGRILARDIVATCDMPPFDRSPLDGYAVRAADTAEASVDRPVYLQVVETVAAGEVPRVSVGAGCATRIMTGAMMPEGADAVIMFEQTENPGQLAEKVGVKRALRSGENVSRRGEEIAEGSVVVRAGERINAGTIALLATLGYSRVSVIRKPRVGLLATGIELVAVDQPLAQGKIRNSNTPMLSALVSEAGGVPRVFPVLPDEPVAAKEALAACVKEVDLLISSGGVSVGDFDVIASLVDDADVELLFNRIAMRPGSPTTALLLAGKPVLALSGNPAACFVGFELFARPALQRLGGQAHAGYRSIRARLASSYEKPCPHPRYMRGRLVQEDGMLLAQPDLNDRAGNLGTLKDSECLIVIPPGGRGKQAGELVEVIVHADSRLSFGGVEA
jgi:molybdopterin molybdotransferase